MELQGGCKRGQQHQLQQQEPALEFCVKVNDKKYSKKNKKLCGKIVSFMF
jgi:hypothetical protein